MRRKNNNYYFALFLIVLFGISIGYALINRTLNITGNSNIEKATWDLHFENIKVKDGSVVAEKEPEIDESLLSLDFSVLLNLPGDFYEFSVDIWNRGTIDAMIESITKTPELTTEQQKYIKYTIEYSTGDSIATKQLVSNNSFVRLKVRIEYRKDIVESYLPTVDQTLDLAFTLNYVQADDTGILVKNNGIVKANGDINQIGTIVTIGSENFYVIGGDEENVNLLTKNKLFVGYEIDSEYIAHPYGDAATGLQFVVQRSLIVFPIDGNIEFSNDEYKGTEYGDYNGSLAEYHVNNYKNKLESYFDVEVKEARLLTVDELVAPELGCTPGGEYCNDSPHSWLNTSCYWLDDKMEPNKNAVVCFGRIMKSVSTTRELMGIRPVISISKDYFK